MPFHFLFLKQSSRKIEEKSNGKEVERMRLQSKVKVKVHSFMFQNVFLEMTSISYILPLVSLMCVCISSVLGKMPETPSFEYIPCW